MAVATRIQERSRRLLEDQTTLRKAKVQLEKIRKRKDRELQQNRATRKCLLVGVIARHRTELELYQAQDRIQHQGNKIHRMESTTQSVRDQTEQIQSQFRNDVEAIYAPHQMKIERCHRLLEAKNLAAQRRQDQAENIKSDIRRLKQARNELRVDRKSLMDACHSLQKEEGQGLQEISNVAMLVRQALAKVRLIAKPRL